jgi:hypothetical protein
MRVDDSSRRRTCATLSNHFRKLTTLTLISFSFIVSPSRKKKETVHQPTLSHHLLSQNSIHHKRKTKWTNKGRKENLSALTYPLWSYLPHNPLHQPPSTWSIAALCCNSETPTTVGLTLLVFLPSSTTKLSHTIFHHD